MKKSITLALTLPALALLAGCGGNKTDTNTTITNTTMTDVTTDTTGDTGNGMMNDTAAMPAMTGQAFADMASASDAYEIAAGKLAAAKATTKGLKDFGTTMVKGHTHSTEKLKEAAKSASPAITPAGMMTAEQKANLATLESATGADFDAAYKSQQVAAHTEALAALRGYAAGGDVASLKTWAVNTAPVVQMHLEKLQGM
jgi:putative membrane protein